MLDPNNSLVKVFFLISSWYIICFPCHLMIKASFTGFKDAKKLMKIGKIINICLFLSLIVLITLVYIERLIQFKTWNIGGNN